MTRDPGAPSLAPTLDCLAYESLLPVLDEPALDPAAGARVREHLAGCAYCRSQVDAYGRVDAALRRHLSDLPFHRTEDIMRQLEEEHAADEAVAQVHMNSPATLTRWRGPRWTRLSAVASVAAVLVVAILMAGLLARHQAAGITGPAARPTHAVSGDAFANAILQDMAMVSPTEGWAAGERQVPAKGGGNAYAATVMHLRDGAWTRTDLPYQTRLLAISMLSPTEGWAGGDANFMLHFDGQRWTPVPLPDNGSFVTQVQEVSPSAVWAVDGSQAGVLHYDGHNWRYQPYPASLNLAPDHNIGLNQLLMVSASEGWAVATITQPTPGQTDSSGDTESASMAIILHYHAGAWQVDTQLPTTSLLSLAVAPDRTVLAAGYTVVQLHPTWGIKGVTYSSDRPIVLAHNGGSWQRDDQPLQQSGAAPASIQTATFLSSSDPWLAAGLDDQTREPRLLHLTTSGWTRATLPVIPGIIQVSLSRIIAASPAESWAIGNTYRCASLTAYGGCDAVSRALILHWVNGTWSVYAG